MKQIAMKYSTFILLILLIASCEKERIVFDESMAVVGFKQNALLIPEDQAEGKEIEIYLGAPSGMEGTEVILEISVEGHSQPAIEGQDFTISSKELLVEIGVTRLTITPVNNNEFTGDKTFTLQIVSNSRDYRIAEESTVVVTLADDEHPLKNWLGNYTVEAVSYDGPGVYDETWTVTVSPVPDQLDQVQIVGVSGSDEPVIATIDKEALAISVEPGQALGQPYGDGYGDVGVFYGGNLKDITWTYPPAELYTEAGETAITGTIAEDGSQILIDNWAHLLTEEEGFIYDVFKTTWIKQ
ncbi:MAG TPA: hypothetical protein ENF21_07045 [Bacteroidetes bacterium]|nr:hypothetical protein [Bacteroidota bacterium]